MLCSKDSLMPLPFEILIQDAFAVFAKGTNLEAHKNKWILSVANDFEDKKWRYGKFEDFIWDNIAETALSQRERESLVNKPYASLREAAKNLRLVDKVENDPKEGSELAEVCLYGIMKHHYGALPVVPKIFYKQNSQDNAKGSDSVHIVLEKENDFSLWLGEAKFYNSIEDVRLGPIVTSVKNSLTTDKLKKENVIITSLSDLGLLIDDIELKEKIFKLLSPSESIDNLKPKLNIPILLLYECDITQKCTIMNDNYRKEIRDYHLARSRSYFSKQVEQLKTINLYSEIKFHVILFPVPSKVDVVKEFLSTVEHLKDKR